MVIGTTDLDKPRDVRSVVWVYVHEQFKKPDHHANDIALLKVISFGDKNILFILMTY